MRFSSSTRFPLISCLGVAALAGLALQACSSDEPGEDVPNETTPDGAVQNDGSVIPEADAGQDARPPATSLRLGVVTPVANAQQEARLIWFSLRVEGPNALASLQWREGDAGEPHEVDVSGAGDEIGFWVEPSARGLLQLTFTGKDSSGAEASVTHTVHRGDRISAGGAHSAMIDETGTLYTWGRNNLVQLGRGESCGTSCGIVQPAPAEFAQPTRVTSILAHQNHTVAMADDGTVYGFGANNHGQLGLGTPPRAATDDQEAAPAVEDFGAHPRPTPALALTDVIALGGSFDHTMWIKRDGTVWSAGSNTAGMLGVAADGEVEQRSWPRRVDVVSDVAEVAGGSMFSAALTRDGSVYTWGRNTYGALGLGTEDGDAHHTPTKVPGLPFIVDIAAGRDHVIALDRDGAIWSWGLNSAGQLGLGFLNDGNQDTDAGSASTAHPNAKKIETTIRFCAVSANTIVSFGISCDGKAYGWGQNALGSLGIGLTQAEEKLREQPTEPAQQLENVTSIAMGGLHVLALRADGKAFAWGWHFAGSLGVPELRDPWSQTVPLLLELDAE